MRPTKEVSAGFDKLSNFRDVAVGVNASQRGQPLKTGQFFRSARPDEASEQDRVTLLHEHHLKTIVDLRTTTELLNAAQKHAAQNKVAESTSHEQLAEKTKIPGITYADINLNGKGFERSLLWHLSYYSLAKVIGLMIWGYRMEAIGIIGREVLQPRGLTGLAIDTIEHSQPEIRAFFELLCEEDVWPIMVHCTQGKDRTGLVVILVLLLCGIDIDVITQDYVQSEPQSEAVLKDRLKDTSSIGLDESFARCPPELPLKVKHHIEEKYGSIDQYLYFVGMSATQLHIIRTRLLANQVDTVMDQGDSMTRVKIIEAPANGCSQHAQNSMLNTGS